MSAGSGPDVNQVRLVHLALGRKFGCEGSTKKLCCQERCVHLSVEGNKSRSVPSAAVATVTSQVVQGLIREAMIHTARYNNPLSPPHRRFELTRRPQGRPALFAGAPLAEEARK